METEARPRCGWGPSAPTARRLAGAVARREIAAEELAAEAGRRAEASSDMNAVAVPMFDEALEAAGRLDAHAGSGPLQGVPVTVKETLWVHGTPCCAGVERLAEARSRSDGAIAAALRRAGAVIAAKGNVAQLLWYAEADNPVYGRTENPCVPGRSAGGSSGGDAALVAAGVVPLAVGTDIGGSVRIPAAWCGCYGFAPTPGRLTTRGSRDDQLFAGTALPNRPGIMARDPGDLRLALAVLDAGAPGGAVPEVPDEPVPQRVRVGVVTRNGVLDPSAAVRRTVLEAADRLAGSGAEVEEIELPDAAEALALFDAVFAVDGGRRLRRLLGDGPTHPHVRRALAAMTGGALDAAGVGRLRTRIAALRRRFWRMLDRARLDVLVGPAHALAAVPHGMALDVVEGQSYASIYSLLGMPAGVAPVSQVGPGEGRHPAGDSARPPTVRRAEAGSRGLPVAVQIAARPWQDDLVLTLLERVSRH
ncbi:MAG TPA: amidase family protein [Gaiellales bacterium]|nr:amidase family protein [Gaiellales bacterium]